MVPSLVPSKFPCSLKKMPKFSVFWIALIDPYRRIAQIGGHNTTTRNMGNIRNSIEGGDYAADHARNRTGNCRNGLEEGRGRSRADRGAPRKWARDRSGSKRANAQATAGRTITPISKGDNGEDAP